ncbi:MAG: hypothetical protein J7K39_02795 [Bacteroidales bacterium]|nr:hypothetical protein [Bacteroidales bacterium]
MKKISWLISLIVFLGVFSSCLKNEICSPVAIELQAGIYTYAETDGIVDTVATKIDIDSIFGISNENNNLLINTSDTELISFPLNDSINKSSFVLNFGLIKDTIHFTYDKHLLFRSVKCGVSYTYTITNIDYTTNFLQDIILSNPEIDVISTENIQLVF